MSSNLSAAQGLSSDSSAKAAAALTEHALGWASANGLSVGVNDPSGLWTTTHLPFTLLPNAIPRSAFENARALAPLFNELVDAISRDAEWLERVLSDVVLGDPFTAELLKIFQEVQNQPQQQLSLGIHRSDYMLHAPEGESPRLLQVELNTVASSFGCLSAQTAKLHRHLIERFAGEPGSVPGSVPGSDGSAVATSTALRGHLAQLGITGANTLTAAQLAQLVPSNPSTETLAAALGSAHVAVMGTQNTQSGQSVGDEEAIVVFVVQPGETNSVDQRLLELALWEQSKIKVRRMSLAEIQTEGSLDDQRRLRVTNSNYSSSSGSSSSGELVSVVYFRAGYTPNDYPSEKEWAGRRLIESSMAIKCPNIGYHLAGTKKVQQVLTQPGEVERFFPSATSSTGSSDGTVGSAEQLRACFAGLWAVGEPDNAAAAAAAADAVADPRGYVLKPQREGGGNNLYGAALQKKLSSGGNEELRSYVLMQRLFPPRQNSVFISRGRRTTGEALSEWGAYSVYLGKGGGESPLLNKYAGHLVRTKLDGVDEGGVATGYAFLSSPILIDDQ